MIAKVEHLKGIAKLYSTDNSVFIRNSYLKVSLPHSPYGNKKLKHIRVSAVGSQKPEELGHVPL